MATVTQIEDNGGNLYDIEDSDAQTKIGNLETAIETIETDYLTPKNEPSIQITLNAGYTAANATITDIVRYGKIMTMNINIDNIAGANIGTTATAVIGQTTLRPKGTTTAILFDFQNTKVARFRITPTGEVSLPETNDIQQGNNKINGSFIMITN